METKEYIKRFPTSLQSVLSNKDNLDKFEKQVIFDYEDVIVYRGLHQSNCVMETDFLNNVENSIQFKVGSYARKRNKTNLKNLSVSVNEDVTELKTALKIPNENMKIYGIARGIMKCIYGPADFEEGRSHHNWYIFQDCIGNVVNEFKVIDEK